MSEEPGKPNGHGEASQEAVLRTLGDALLDRYEWAKMAGLTFGGARDEYAIFGYDRQVTTRQYREEYQRGGLAGRIVDVMPDATWRGEMWLEEDEDPEKITPFEQAWLDLDQRLQIQAKLLRVDKLSRLSTYAVLLIGAGGDLSTELPNGTPDKLLYLTPYSGGGGPGMTAQSRALATDADCSIAEFDIDPASPRFGLPLFYNLKRTDIASPAFQRPVHWTRIHHVAEGCLDNDVYGMPALERVWNLLADLRKVTGGGAEAFWLRANQGMHLDIDKDMSLPAAKDSVEALKEQVEKYKHGIDRWLRTRGVDVKMLGSDVANFENPADAIITQIAGAKAIPKRILTGSEMGELASSQDRENFKDQINGRQTSYVGPYIVRPLVDRLIKYGYLPTPTGGAAIYEVKWPHIQTLTEQEKADGAAKWATTNQTQGATVFTDAEIRDKWYGLKPLSPEQLAEIDAAKQKVIDAQAPPEVPEFKAAAQEDDEMVRVLEAAIVANNTDVIDRIVGIHHVVLSVVDTPPPNIVVNVPQAAAPEAPTVIVNVPDQRSIVTASGKRLEYDDEGRIVRIVPESVQ